MRTKIEHKLKSLLENPWFLKNKKIVVLIMAVLAAVIAISLISSVFHKDDNIVFKGKKRLFLSSVQEKNARIMTQILVERDIPLLITIPAQFKAISKFQDRVFAPIDGKVTQIFVEPGNLVKRGQALVEIKSDEIGQIQLEFLDKYIEVDSNVKQMTAQYNLSVQNYKRENILFHEGISSRAEYEVARAQMQKDKANLDSLRVARTTLVKVYGQRVALYGGNENTIRRALATKSIYPYITLRSNKTGVVLDRKVNPGEIVEKDKEIFDVADLSTIWLVGYAFEKDAPLLKEGQEVIGTLEETHDTTVKGKLSYVAAMLDTESKTLEVHADIPNQDYAIKPNMYAEMDVNVGTINALAVPNSALQKYGDYTFAYVKVKPGVYEERKVKIGHNNDFYSEVKSGLKSGEIVVVRGGFSLLGESIKKAEE